MGLVQKGKVLKILFALLGLNTFMQSVHIQKRERSGLMAQLTSFLSVFNLTSVVFLSVFSLVCFGKLLRERVWGLV